MQASHVQTLSGLLPQLLGAGGGAADVLESAGGEGFVQSMATQIKVLMIQQGEDPVELADLDDASLVAQFLALVQGQVAARTAGADSVSNDMSNDMQWLFDGSLETADASDVSGGDADRAGVPCCLPSFVLEQLARSSQVIASSDVDSDLGLTSGSGASAGSGVDASALRALLQRLTTMGSDVARAEGDAGLEAARGSTLASWWTGGPDVREAAALDEIASAWSTSPVGSGASPRLATGVSLELANALEGEANGDETGLTDRMLESVGDSLGDLLMAGTSRIATTATDTASLGARARSLDLAGLLQPGGEAALAEQVKWSLKEGLETAELKLHPPSLGALDVRVSMDGDKANVHFVSSHPIVREVLEAAMPRLREALAQDGLSLGQVSVSDQAPSDRGETGQDQGGRMGAGASDSEVEGESDEGMSGSDSTLYALSRRLDVFI